MDNDASQKMTKEFLLKVVKVLCLLDVLSDGGDREVDLKLAFQTAWKKIVEILVCVDRVYPECSFEMVIEIWKKDKQLGK